MAKNSFSDFKNMFLKIISLLALVLIAWFLFFGKIKGLSALAPFLNKLPKNESELIGVTENILGEAVQKVKSGGTLNKIASQGNNFIEQSDYAQPVRDIRENIKQKVDETMESAKQLPASEINIIKHQICKEWFDQEIATGSGNK